VEAGNWGETAGFRAAANGSSGRAKGNSCREAVCRHKIAFSFGAKAGFPIATASFPPPEASFPGVIAFSPAPEALCRDAEAGCRGWEISEIGLCTHGAPSKRLFSL
jgi:hypothetical protein